MRNVVKDLLTPVVEVS